MQSAPARNIWLAHAKLAAVAFCWGSAMIAGRVIAAKVPVLTASTIRLAIASFVLLVLLRRFGPLPRVDRKQFATLTVMGFCGVFIFNIFFFAALQKIPASKGALIVALVPVLTALVVAVLLRERIKAQRWMGIALALAGVSVVVTHGQLQLLASYLGDTLGSGEGLMMVAALGWVGYTVISRVALKGLSALAASTYAACIGFALLAIALLTQPENWQLDWIDWHSSLALVYIAVIGTALPYVWFVQGVQALGPARTAVYINLTPVFGVSLGFLVLGEAIDSSMLIGGLIVIAGVTLTNRSNA